jgi:hypothetical protein
MRRAYYSSSIIDFLAANPNAIIGELTRAHARNLDQTQLNAWLEQINILKEGASAARPANLSISPCTLRWAAFLAINSFSIASS